MRAFAARAASRATTQQWSARYATTSRAYATASLATGSNHKIAVIGGGTAGMAISHQLLRSGKFSQDDICVIDPATWHHYQPGWTLVGGGLKQKEDLRRKLDSLVDSKIKLYVDSAASFDPENNRVTLSKGDSVNYDHLIVAPGLSVNLDSVEGLSDALADRHSPVSTIYSYETCDKAFRTIEQMQKGSAIFTQPGAPIKCAGAPQKIMWLALDFWKQAGLYSAEAKIESPINITFASGMGGMFAVPKYAAKLEQLRQERGVEGLFQHDLVAVKGDKAIFARPNGEEAVTKQFDLLHVVPKMGPHAAIKGSTLANEAGYVDVDDGTLQHKKYPNIWSAGDASSLPTSKTAAAVTSESPVLVRNLLQTMEGKELDALYDGYTSCPLLTEYGKVLLAEFKYGGVPKETFDDWLGVDQIHPRRAFYHLKKDFFPWVYFNSMVKGTWGGPKGWLQ